MTDIDEFYFENDGEWREWLEQNHAQTEGVHLIFFAVAHEKQSMRWEEAVRVALCFGWIDSTVKSLGDGKRRQYFCPRRPKSGWSRVNKTHVDDLIEKGLMHASGLAAIEAAKANGSWAAMDDVENGVIPPDLKDAFELAPKAFENFQKFTRPQRKGYLYWIHSAKREQTRQKRIAEIIRLCAANIKSRT